MPNKVYKPKPVAKKIEPVVEPSYNEEDYEAPIVKTPIFKVPAKDYKAALVTVLDMIQSGKHVEKVIKFIKSVL